jgi:hypothetical protein
VWFAKAFQPGQDDAVGKPKEPGLHIRRKCGDFSGDSIVEDFYTPRHGSLYLNFEIQGSKKSCLNQIGSIRGSKDAQLANAACYAEVYC